MLNNIRAREEWAGRNVVQKGFTLVELLVVIVILGILAAVVVFAVNGIQDRGTTAACAEDSRTVRTAIEAYRAKNNATDNPTMAQLVTAGLLSTASTNYPVIAYSGSAYTMAGANGCPNA